MKIKTLLLALLGLIYGYNEIYAQNYGPELLTNYNFGTTNDGVTGVNTTNLYPTITSPNLNMVYSQPPNRAYVNNTTLNSTSPAPQSISINPQVTVAPPLSSSQTYYKFGFSEPTYSNFYSFLKSDGSNSAVQIPMAPGVGYYVIATSTNGMFSLPTSTSGTWFTIYDKYETNIANPTNYFLIFNSDATVNKPFYMQKVTAVTPGHVYRMSADYVRLNASASPPNFGFLVMPATGNDATDITNLQQNQNLIASTGNIQDKTGQWLTLAFDYVVPCTATNGIWIAFANEDHGQNGNNLAMDNLSVKEILAQTTMSVANNCSSITLTAVIGLQSTSGYTFAWYHNGTLISGQTGQTLTIPTTPAGYGGNYYYTVTHTGNTTCHLTSASITVSEINVANCNTTPPPICPVNDRIQAVPGSVNSPFNILENDCNAACGGVTCDSTNLRVLNFTIPGIGSGYGLSGGGPYSPGTPIVVADSVGNTVGVLTIDNKGNLTFQSAAGYQSATNGGFLNQVHFNYTAVDTQTGATASTYVDIVLTQLAYTTTASCAGFPVRIEFDVPQFLPEDFTYTSDYATYLGVSSSIPIPYPTYFNSSVTPIPYQNYFFTSPKPSTVPQPTTTLPANDYFAGYVNDIVATRFYLVDGNTYASISDETLLNDLTNNIATNIRRIDVVRTNDPDNGGKIIFEFIENTSGTHSYQLRKKQIGYPTQYALPGYIGTMVEDPILHKVLVEVCPKTATWGGVSSNLWQDANNWISHGLGTACVTWCTDVTIPGPESVLIDSTGNATVTILKNFPALTQGDACKDIVFNMGASVGGIQNLIYRAAYVEYQPPMIQNYGYTDKWTMITVPLKYVYSADFQPDTGWGADAFTDIKSYMSYFDMAYSNNVTPNPDGVTGTYIGSFSRPFADLKQKLQAGLGFASNVVLTGNGGTTFTETSISGRGNSTFYFPRYKIYGDAKSFEAGPFESSSLFMLQEAQYAYHWSDNGEWIYTHPTNSNYNSFTFAEQRGSVGVKTYDSAWNPDFYNTTTATYSPFVYSEPAAEYILPLPNPLTGQDSRYRFIYEEDQYNYNASTGEFTLPISGTGSTRIVGNPLMSHLDFDVFYNTNESNIQPYYRIWDGTNFYTYTATGFSDPSSTNVWSGMNNLSTDPDITNPVAYRYIPPIQAFFIDVVNENNPLTLNFNTAMSTAIPNANILIDVNGDGSLLIPANNELRARPHAVNENLLKLRLKMNEIETVALLASLPNASDHYVLGEDIYKLFSYDNATPEIYTVSDNKAIEINAVSQQGEQKLIPLGIKTNQTGQFEILIEGAADFNAYEQVFLRDALENKNYDLKECSSFTFEKTSSENLEGRFYILLGSEEETTETTTILNNQEISIVWENGAIRVYSPIYAIESFEVHDISGRLLFKDTKIGASSYLWNPRLEQGIYLLNVRAGKANKVQKIKW